MADKQPRNVVPKVGDRVEWHASRHEIDAYGMDVVEWTASETLQGIVVAITPRPLEQRLLVWAPRYGYSGFFAAPTAALYDVGVNRVTQVW